jgi:16S rRNA (adenine1518-N6/adenine1519-N6)-dimethyltransferase
MNTRRRALGQHFLRDRSVARAVVDLVAPTASDLAVEIGPGEGALTADLAARSGRLIALEVDRVLAARLRDRFSATATVEVIDADARTWDYGLLERPCRGRVLVVGNLPYSVAKPILMALVAARRVIDDMALMLQLEVAERLAAAPGGKVYGSLSVLTQLYCDARVAFRVPPGAFRPPPKVDSAVVHLTPLRAPRVTIDDETRFQAIVRAAFSQRRKMLGNAVAGSLALPVDLVRRAAEAAGIDPARRAETLTIDEFAALAWRLPAMPAGGHR